MKKKSTLKSLDQLVDEEYGKRGEAKREKMEKGYKEFKLRAFRKRMRQKFTFCEFSEKKD
jgi:HTH-type transcriptional regulator / antitoxin HipB